MSLISDIALHHLGTTFPQHHQQWTSPAWQLPYQTPSMPLHPYHQWTSPSHLPPPAPHPTPTATLQHWQNPDFYMYCTIRVSCMLHANAPPPPPCNSGFTTNRHPVRHYSRYSRRLTHPRPAQATPEGTVRLPAAVWPQDSPLQVMPNGITPLPQKVEAVREFLLLTTVIAVIVTDQGTYWI
ncbi:hypothetical protein Pmani_002320 [Petrolisthes manimaculis]|uniref:Uncharacterized protein n=1 Tax=Petrolisthes manimaculis TaxID=1843537 RepID=A0AAE1QHT3_9EUCA|nr:hypothetical protein Pmani_002320 [Petrolisthes manimaculis]